MLRRNLVMTLVLVVGLAGCAQAPRAERSPETDALLQAARAGHSDAVKSILAGAKADVNGGTSAVTRRS